MSTAPYPNQIASGLGSAELPAPFELWAGESDIVTDRAVVETDFGIFTVIAMNEDGKLLPWSPDTGAASGVLTFSGTGTAADTITVNGHVITMVASGAVGPQIVVGATPTETAQNFRAYINSHPDETKVLASGAAAAITLRAVVAGSAGNAITTVESGTGTSFGAATLTGGTDETDAQIIGVSAQAGVAGKYAPYYKGGQFNHEALVWPASINTLALRQLACRRAPFGVAKLL